MKRGGLACTSWYSAPLRSTCSRRGGNRTEEIAAGGGNNALQKIARNLLTLAQTPDMTALPAISHWLIGSMAAPKCDRTSYMSNGPPPALNPCLD